MMLIQLTPAVKATQNKDGGKSPAFSQYGLQCTCSHESAEDKWLQKPSLKEVSWEMQEAGYTVWL